MYICKKNMNNNFSRLLCPLIALLLCFFVAGCQQPRHQSSSKQTISSNNSDTSVRFPYPDIPPVLISPEERSIYLLCHYWEKFDFKDDKLLQFPELTERGIVDYLDLLTLHASSKAVKESLQAFCRQFALYPRACKTMQNLMEKYLYEANSPLHNEQLFAVFLETMEKEPTLKSDPSREHRIFLQKLLKRNTPGEQACNFTCYTADGKLTTLYQTPKTQKILFFYDPQCENCLHTLLKLKTNRELADAIDEGNINVIAVYTEDDENLWKTTLNDLPENWLAVTDRGYIRNEALYDLKAMPTFYLLNASHKVILKDATLEEIFAYLGFNNFD